MATQNQIEQFNQKIQQFREAYAGGLSAVFTGVFDQLAAESISNRASVVALFAPVFEYTNQNLTKLRDVLEINTEMNQTVLGELTDEDIVAAEQIASAVSESVNSEINNRVETTVNSIMLAVAVGAVTPALIQELRNSVDTTVSVLSNIYEQALRQFDGAVTRSRGASSDQQLRYRYTGSIISESRDFCRQMTGRVLTEAEAEQIWRTQEWSGKRPGDPFVVRGGYNCRHSWTVEPQE